MPKSYSPQATTEYNRLNATDRPVLLLEILHPDQPEPIRIAQGNDPITHLGNEYLAVQFRAALPDDLDQEEPRATLEIDNVGGILLDWIDATNGGTGAEVRFIQVRPSDPDTVENDLRMDLANVDMNPLVVSGELAFDSILNLPGIAMRHTPENTPGIF